MKLRCIDCGKEISPQEAYGKPITYEERKTSGAYAVYNNAYCLNCAKTKDFETYCLAENSFGEVSLSWREWRISMLIGAIIAIIISVVFIIFGNTFEINEFKIKLLITLLGFFGAWFHIFDIRGNRTLWAPTQVVVYVFIQPIFIFIIASIMFKMKSLL
jgi:hypothetical protein